MDSQLKNGDPNPPASDDAVELQVFTNPDSANLARGILEANGIECWLAADDCGGMLAAVDLVRGIKLLVRSESATVARELLKAEVVPELESIPPQLSPPPLPASGFKLSLPQIILGVFLGIVLCLLYQKASKLGTKTYRYDTNGDRKVDVVWVYRNGECIEVDEDRNFDGRMDAWTYYGAGYRRSSAVADNNFDGAPDVWWSYTNGIPATARSDTDFNGTPDVTYFFKDEVVIRSDWQPNGTNVITLRQIFRHGFLVSESRDTNMDGTFDVTIQFDAFQNPVSANAFNLLSTPQ